MSVFPSIADTGLTDESPENVARWQRFTVSFCLLRGLNISLSGDVPSRDILQICQVSTLARVSNLRNGKILLNLPSMGTLL